MFQILNLITQFYVKNIVFCMPLYCGLDFSVLCFRSSVEIVRSRGVAWDTSGKGKTDSCRSKHLEKDRCGSKREQSQAAGDGLTNARTAFTRQRVRYFTCRIILSIY